MITVDDDTGDHHHAPPGSRHGPPAGRGREGSAALPGIGMGAVADDGVLQLGGLHMNAAWCTVWSIQQPLLGRLWGLRGALCGARSLGVGAAWRDARHHPPHHLHPGVAGGRCGGVVLDDEAWGVRSAVPEPHPPANRPRWHCLCEHRRRPAPAQPGCRRTHRRALEASWRACADHHGPNHGLGGDLEDHLGRRNDRDGDASGCSAGEAATR